MKMDPMFIFNNPKKIIKSYGNFNGLNIRVKHTRNSSKEYCKNNTYIGNCLLIDNINESLSTNLF